LGDPFAAAAVEQRDPLAIAPDDSKEVATILPFQPAGRE